MPERYDPDDDVTMAFPPAWCSRACKNALSDKCLEGCAIRRDGSWFDPRQDVAIADLPRFPLRAFVEDMGPKERTLAIGLYTALIADQAQGRPAAVVRRKRGTASSWGRLSVDDEGMPGLAATTPRDGAAPTSAPDGGAGQQPAQDGSS